VLFLLAAIRTADGPYAFDTADRMGQIRESRLEEDRSEAILAATVAAEGLAGAFEAAGRFWWARHAGAALRRLLLATFAVLAAGRD
jgi:hypothetical protein